MVKTSKRRSESRQKTTDERREAFIREYLIDRRGRGAAIRAGFGKAGAAVRAAAFLKEPYVIAEIARRGEALATKTELNAQMVADELRKVAFSNITDFLTWDNRGAQTIVPSKDLPPDKAAALAEFQSTRKTVTVHGEEGDSEVEREEVTIKFKTHPKLQALELIGKHLGMWKEKVEHQHSFAPTFLFPPGSPQEALAIVSPGAGDPEEGEEDE